VDNTRGYARVSHSRQWSNYNLFTHFLTIYTTAHDNLLELRKKLPVNDDE